MWSPEGAPHGANKGPGRLFQNKSSLFMPVLRRKASERWACSEHRVKIGELKGRCLSRCLNPRHRRPSPSSGHHRFVCFFVHAVTPCPEPSGFVFICIPCYIFNPSVLAPLALKAWKPSVIPSAVLLERKGSRTCPNGPILLLPPAPPLPPSPGDPDGRRQVETARLRPVHSAPAAASRK